MNIAASEIAMLTSPCSLLCLRHESHSMSPCNDFAGIMHGIAGWFDLCFIGQGINLV